MLLGKRKRDIYDRFESGTKRRKMDLILPSNRGIINPFISILIPPPPPPTFPLFNLPAELRAQILDQIYGQQTIHVSLKSLNKPAEASASELQYTIRRKPTYPHFETALALPPRVSKRFYTEATAVLYASSIFSFDAPHAFRAFALSNHQCVSRVQQVAIPRLTHHWTTALVTSLVGRLTNLRGVQLSLQHFRCSDVRALPCATDAVWKDCWRMIRAFQQHELDAQKTDFELTVLNVFQKSPLEFGSWTTKVLRLGEPQYDNMLRLRKAFTEGLLKYTPRRLSKRDARARV